jgi:hypothetical protein
MGGSFLHSFTFGEQLQHVALRRRETHYRSVTFNTGSERVPCEDNYSDNVQNRRELSIEVIFSYCCC